MVITAKNIGRINVWPTYDIAREADTEECKFVGQLTVWRTNEEARANISHEEEGGGGRPAWVPENAVIHIDLVGGDPQGLAWTEAAGEVAVDTLLGADPNTETGWGASDYNPAMLAANGYGDGETAGTNPAFIGELLTRYLSDNTLVVQFYQNELASGPVVLLLSADGNDAMETKIAVEAENSDAKIQSWNGSLNATAAGAANYTPGGGAINRIAATIDGIRAEIAANGSAAATGVIEDEDRPAANPFVAAMVDMSNSSIQSITLYDALPDTTGLSELSEV